MNTLLQGDIERMKDGPVIMTIHDVGSSFHSMVEFTNHEDMQEVKNRYSGSSAAIFKKKI